MKNESIQFMEEYCEFKDNWVWILTGIARNKDNETNEKFLKRFVIKSKNDISDSYFLLKEMMNKSGVTYRIYLSLNARDANKTLFNFQKKLIDLSYDASRGIENNNIKNIGSLWKTELAQSCNRATKNFLLDIDDFQDEDKVRELCASNKPEIGIVCIRRTPSGLACVINPNDTRGLVKSFKDNNIEMNLQRDSLLFIEQFTA